MQVVFSPLALSDVGTGLDARESLYSLSQVITLSLVFTGFHVYGLCLCFVFTGLVV